MDIRITWEEAKKQFQYAESLPCATALITSKRKNMAVIGLDNDSKVLLCYRWSGRFQSLDQTSVLRVYPSEITCWKLASHVDANEAKGKFNVEKYMQSRKSAGAV